MAGEGLVEVAGDEEGAGAGFDEGGGGGEVVVPGCDGVGDGVVCVQADDGGGVLGVVVFVSECESEHTCPEGGVGVFG